MKEFTLPNTNSVYYFAESAFYWDEESKKEAENYLKLWKKFTLMKLERETYKAKFIDEMFVTRDPMFDRAFSGKTRLSLKIAVEIEFRFEVPDLNSLNNWAYSQ